MCSLKCPGEEQQSRVGDPVLFGFVDQFVAEKSQCNYRKRIDFDFYKIDRMMTVSRRPCKKVLPSS